MFENSADALQRKVRVQNYYPGITYFSANYYRDPATQTWHLDNTARGSVGMILNTADWTATGMRNYLQLWASPNGVPGANGLVLWDSGKLTVNKPLTVAMPNAPGLVDILGTGSTSTTASLVVSNSNSASLLCVRDDGAVGIGTATPSQIFHVHGSGTWAGTRVTTAGTGATIGDGVNFGYDDAAGAYVWNREASPLIFSTSDTERVRIDASGRVGIGTTTPGAGLTDPTVKLDVQGSINVSGNINAKYQDVAEWVPSVQKLSAGTVVVLDGGRANHVLASSKAYDTAVAGVVSDSPGVILGEGGDGKLKVATTGRVKVRVDATRAPIRVGDLLVTGEAEGVAMKSVPVELGGVSIHRPGTIIGKALEPLERGTGEILVLLSLQ